MIDWFLQLYSYAMQVISVNGPQDLIAITLVATFSEFGIPFPMVVDTLLLLSGYHVSDFWLQTIVIMSVLMAGRVIGSSLVYVLAHTLGSPIVNWLKIRFPSWKTRADNISSRFGLINSLTKALSRLGEKASHAASARSFGFAPPITVASARLVPGLMVMTSVAAGMLGLRYRYFILGIGIASILSDIATISLGAITGYGMRRLEIDPSSWMVLAVIVINIGILMVLQRFLCRRLARKCNNVVPNEVQPVVSETL